MLSIIVAFPKLDDANKIKNILVRNGYEVALSCNNAAQIISLCGKLEEGIIICGYKLADMMYTELFGYLPGRIFRSLFAFRVRREIGFPRFFHNYGRCRKKKIPDTKMISDIF